LFLKAEVKDRNTDGFIIGVVVTAEIQVIQSIFC